MEKILNHFGYFKRKKKRYYKEIRYIQSEEPIDVGDRLLQLTAEGNEWTRNRQKEDYELVGMFFYYCAFDRA